MHFDYVVCAHVYVIREMLLNNVGSTTNVYEHVNVHTCLRFEGHGVDTAGSTAKVSAPAL